MTENDAEFEAIVGDLDDIAPIEALRNQITVTMEIEGHQYGSIFRVPAGFPERHADPEAVGAIYASQIAQSVYLTFTQHYFGGRL